MAFGFPTASFSDSEEGLFSSAEIRSLMRIEYERAQRYAYPLVLMLIEVDRLEYLKDLYGTASKEEILQAVIVQLRGLTRESDFLGCMHDERIQAVFPHTPEEAAGEIAGRLLRGARGLRFESGGRRLRVTLSIGLAVSDADRLLDFEEFLGEAHDSLAFAVRAGGDRYVRRERATWLIEQLREELEAEAETLRQVRDAVVDEERLAWVAPLLDAPSPPEVAEAPPFPEAPLGLAPAEGGEGSSEAPPDASAESRLKALFDRLESRPPEVQRLEHAVIEEVRELLRQARRGATEDAIREHHALVDRLERRISKLKSTLDQTESELRAVAAARNVDPGLASVYRTVQGLALDEKDYGRKKEMLTILFESNKELRREIRHKAERRPRAGE